MATIEDQTVEERTQPQRTVASTYGRSMAATESTMAAMEERTQTVRTMAETHGLINGGNGGAKLVEAIIQSKLVPISGGN